MLTPVQGASSRNCAGCRDVVADFVMLEMGVLWERDCGELSFKWGFFPSPRDAVPAAGFFWDLEQPRPSREPAPASGATHSVFAMPWHWFPSKVTMGRICPPSDREPLPGQDSVGDVCCCSEKGCEQPSASIPSVSRPLTGAFPSWVLKGGKKRADRAGTALRWN